jgi:hypothetical protein
MKPVIASGALVLIVLAEVLLALVGLPARPLLVLLLAASTLAAALLLFELMHLRFESRALVAALVPLVTVCILLLAAMLPDSFRIVRLRTAQGEVPSSAPASR